MKQVSIIALLHAFYYLNYVLFGTEAIVWRGSMVTLVLSNFVAIFFNV